MARSDDMLGNRKLTHFDVCVIGSGPGGGTAAHVLTRDGKNVLVLEAGPNFHPHLDKPGAAPPLPLYSNDEVKFEVHQMIDQQSILEPRTFRIDASKTAAINDDVNLIPRQVGGGWNHADMKTPRFTAVDFQLKTKMEALIGATPGLVVPGFGADAGSANFADWPFTYDDLELFYVEAEKLTGVQGDDSNPFAPPRSQPYPMPPGVAMYLGNVISHGAALTDFFGSPLHPHPYPAAVNSQFYDGRPPCVDCGVCSGFGCPNNSKGGPSVTSLRKALLTKRCQLRFNCHVTKLVNDGGHVSAVEYVDGAGVKQTATADAFILAAGPIESARLCFLSETPSHGVLGNSSDQVGRNLMFHFQTNVNAFLPNRIHANRGRAVTHGLSDFRGVMQGGDEIRLFPDGMGGQRVAMGGVCEFSAPQGLPITEDGETYAISLPAPFGIRFGSKLKNALRDQPLGQHLFGMIMQAEDAPQITNRVDLDPTVKDVFGLPVPRVTYKNHPYEKNSRLFYVPYMKQVLTNAGGTHTFTAPCDAIIPGGGPPTSRHILGTLRMGSDSATSVLNPQGKFHDVDNLYACDGSTFVTSAGWNPTLTIIAVALKIAHGITGTPPAA